MPLARYLFFLVGTAAIAATGCGGSPPEAVPVRGKVLLDGQPLTRGTVTTIPAAGRGSWGAIQPDGTFELSTYGKSDGARPGLHRAAVVAQEPSKESGPEAPPGKLLVPKKYTDAMTSELTIEVKADGENTAVLELKSK